MVDESPDWSVVVTVGQPIQTEQGGFETFKAIDYTERSDCMAFHGTDISEGVVQIQRSNLEGVVYL